MIDRLRELMDGSSPEDPHEEIFVHYYSKALRGETLLSIVVSSNSEVAEYSHEELGMLTLGYAFGEKIRHDNEQSVDLTTNDNDQTH